MNGTAWQMLAGLEAYRVDRVLRRVQPEAGSPAGVPAGRDASRAQRAAVLSSAYHAANSRDGDPGAIAIGWVRASAGGPVDVLVAGAALRGSAGGGPDGSADLTAAGTDVRLALPSGGRGHVIPAAELTGAMSALPCWTAVAGLADGLLSGEPDVGQQHPVSLDECLLAAWDGPFGWLLVAEPVGTAALEKIAAQVADRQRLTEGLAERSPEKAVEAQRLQHRHAELRQGLSAGMWRLHLMAGGADPQQAARIAGLVCASADLSGLPYALTPSAGPTGPLAGLLDTPPEQDTPARAGSGPAFPLHASTGLVATLARVPEIEVPGLRLELRPEFDVTPERPALPSGPGSEAATILNLGVVLDRNGSPAGSFPVSTASLNRHVFVCGATGAGKSQTVRALLEAASQAGLPWLVVEPAKAEYRLMALRMKGPRGVLRIRPGEADQVAAGINPLEPAVDEDGRRFPLQTHADLVRALFLASFAADEPFPQVLSAAVTRVYEEAGWDLALGEPATPGLRPRYPTLSDLQAAAERIVTEIGYGREVTDNVRGFIKVRLSSLRLGTTGRFLEGGHPIDFGKLLQRNVVLEIEDVGDDRDKAFLMGTVLIQLTEHLRLRARSSHFPSAPGAGAAGLRHLSVFEEAHRLLRKPTEDTSGAATHAVEMFAGLLAEIRAYGEGLIIAEQIPAKLIPDVVKNTAVKIVHRLPAADDREAVGATMNMTDAQSKYLVTMPPGRAAVFTDGMDYPVLAAMPDGTAREAGGDSSTGAAGLSGLPLRGTAGMTGSPAAIVSPRSGTCGTDCRSRPCTLRDMRAAQRALDQQPGLVMWSELAVLAHLTGWLMPVPHPDGDLARQLGGLRGGFFGGLAMAPRLRDCALSHAVDAAVAGRAATFCTRVSADALAAHVVSAMRRWLGDGGRECAFPEPRWLAPAYQWALILDDLKTMHNQDPSAGRHPLSSNWERANGRSLTGETCADQLRIVQRWCDTDQRDTRALRTLAFGAEVGAAGSGISGSGAAGSGSGVTVPSGLERAVGARLSDGDWVVRLTAALDEFDDCRWPLDYLCGRRNAAGAVSGVAPEAASGGW